MAKEFIASQTVNAALSSLDLYRYPNGRTIIDDSDIQTLVNSISTKGLIQNPSGMRQPNGSIGISCGFSRLEAMQRIALKPVFDEYNKTNGFAPDNPLYLALNGNNFENRLEHTKSYRASSLDMRKGREKIRERGPEWSAKYDAALASFEVPVGLFTYESDKEAMLHNATENNNRTNLTLLDKMRQYETLRGMEFTQGEIAAAMKFKTPAMASHFQRVVGVVPTLQKLAVKADGTEDGRFMVCINEIQRRIALAEDNPEFITFRALREFSNNCFPKDQDKQPKPEIILQILADLSRVNPTKWEATDENTLECSVFESKMKDTIKLSLAPPAPPAAAVQATTTDVQAPVAAQPPGTVMPLPSPTAAVAPATVSSAIAGTAGVIPTAAATAAPSPASLATPDDLAMAQAMAFASNATGPTDINATTDLDGVDVSMDGDDAEFAEAAIAAASGQQVAAAPGEKSAVTKTKTVDTVVSSKYNPLSPDKVERYAQATLSNLVGDAGANATPFDVASMMAMALAYYTAAGMDKEASVISNAHMVYSENLEKWIVAVEKAITDYAPAEIAASVRKMKPTTPEITG